MFENLSQLIESRNFAAIKQELSEMNVVDIAELFEKIDEEVVVKIFRLMPKGKAADAFSYMSKEMQQQIVEAITDRELSGIVDELFLDDTVDLIEEMPATVVKKVLANTTESKRKLINQFLQYNEDSAGSLMTIEFVNLKKEMTVRDAFSQIRRTGVDKETIYTCYVTTKNRKLAGCVSAKTLLLSDEDALIGDIMDTNVLYAATDDDKEEIANTFHKYNLLSLPVVDRERRLVGIITIDDAIDVIQEENTEVFEKMAAVTPSEEPYLKTSSLKHSANLIPCLLILTFTATFTGMIITKFESAFQAVPILVAFIPMLMNTGGNCGSQSAALVIRGMALSEIEWRDTLKVWWKEVRVSLIVGIVLGIATFLRVWFFNDYNMALSLTICLSVIATVIIAKSIGCLLPIFAKQIGLDPAIMAAPIITTIVDALALVIYFSVAKAVMGI